MADPRVERLAQAIIGYSLGLRPGEKLLIELMGLERPLADALIRKAHAAGAMPFLTIKDPALLRSLLLECSPEQLERTAAYEAARMAEMDAYVAIRAPENLSELADVPAERMALYNRLWVEPVHYRIRVPRTRWCVLRYPNAAMAQQARMSQEAFADFYFEVCGLDYAELARRLEPLAARMEQADEVRITGPGTDLRFSIKGMPAVICAGRRNIPDGEVYTAPVKESVEGTLTYNTPTTYMGATFENVSFRFEGGRIVEATATGPAEKLRQILDADEGARWIGEFALGVNPKIHRPIGDTLFDEKIHGSFHFTPGAAYEAADNGNRSAIHWDIVCIQRPEYGGGEIRFDGELIRRGGRFVPPDLEPLNPPLS